MAEKRESNIISELKVKVDVDCSEALKGLKAITRAAKEAIAALKELEQLKSQTLNVGITMNGSEIAKIVSEQLSVDEMRKGRM